MLIPLTSHTNTAVYARGSWQRILPPHSTHDLLSKAAVRQGDGPRRRLRRPFSVYKLHNKSLSKQPSRHVVRCSHPASSSDIRQRFPCLMCTLAVLATALHLMLKGSSLQWHILGFCITLGTVLEYQSRHRPMHVEPSCFFRSSRSG